MSADRLLVIATVFVASALLTGLIRRIALARGMLDMPNSRSSHLKPTPRGGGVAIALPVLLATALMLERGQIPAPLAAALLVGGPIIALVGFLDDLHTLSVSARLATQFAVVSWCVWWLGPLPAIDFGLFTLDSGVVSSIFGVIFLVWFLNLFNFMDGIDGLAGMEVISVMVFATILVLWQNGEPSAAHLLLTMAAAAAGFLVWNWPPARIFMGDAGSGFLGFFAGIVAWTTIVHHRFSVWVWLVLFGAFVVDATVTLLRRWWRGARLAEAHRTHTYQRLSRKFDSHKKVTLGILFVNVLWLDPLAFLATMRPALGPFVTLVAWAPLITVAWRCGAGSEGD
jgi:Fuc2NAc and GlcNAc transferase